MPEVGGGGPTSGGSGNESSPGPLQSGNVIRDRRKSRSCDGGRESEPLLDPSPDRKLDGGGKTNVDFVPEAVEESEESIVLEETEIPRDSKCHRTKGDSPGNRRARLPTPPPVKNVSFGQFQEQSYLEQPILPPPVQFVPKHRHTGQ